jgi:SAM-dependent methyltransferase
MRGQSGGRPGRLLGNRIALCPSALSGEMPTERRYELVLNANKVSWLFHPLDEPFHAIPCRPTPSLFGCRPQIGARTNDAPSVAYSGTDNLEIMEEASNYNAFLLNLVTAHTRLDDEILDFGAGTGVLARPLAAAGYRISCIEPAEQLRSRLQASGLVTYPVGQELASESFDLIYTFNVLEHIQDHGGTLVMLRRLLKPGGQLVVYVPAFPILYSSIDRKIGHLRRYRHAELGALLQEAGMRIGYLGYQDSLGFAAALIFKLVGNDNGNISRRALLACDRYVFGVSRFIDRWASRFFGKNLLAVTYRDD